eukprot:g34035.t1
MWLFASCYITRLTAERSFAITRRLYLLVPRRGPGGFVLCCKYRLKNFTNDVLVQLFLLMQVCIRRPQSADILKSTVVILQMQEIQIQDEPVDHQDDSNQDQQQSLTLNEEGWRRFEVSSYPTFTCKCTSSKGTYAPGTTRERLRCKAAPVFWRQ